MPDTNTPVADTAVADTAVAETTADSSSAADLETNMNPISEQVPDVAQWVPQVLQPLWQTVEQYPLLGALIVAVVFYGLALVLRSILISIIGRLTGLTTSNYDSAIVAHLRI